MKTQFILKALSDTTRFKIIKMLLSNNYCVGAMSRKLNISESAVSQHVKVLKETGLVSGRKSGYYMHYDVNRDLLIQLSKDIEELANIDKEFKASLDCGGNCNKKDKCNEEL